MELNQSFQEHESRDLPLIYATTPLNHLSGKEHLPSKVTNYKISHYADKKKYTHMAFYTCIKKSTCR
jgi:hypothetical protein